MYMSSLVLLDPRIREDDVIEDFGLFRRTSRTAVKDRKNSVLAV